MDTLEFSQYGLLIPREQPYRMTLAQIRQQFGRGNHARRNIYQGLALAVNNLSISGVKRIILGGSFVSLKTEPNDVDMAWWYEPTIDWATLDKVFQTTERRGAKAKYLVDQKIDGLRDIPYEQSHEYFLRSNTRMPVDFQTVGIVLILR